MQLYHFSVVMHSTQSRGAQCTVSTLMFRMQACSFPLYRFLLYGRMQLSKQLHKQDEWQTRRS